MSVSDELKKVGEFKVSPRFNFPASVKPRYNTPITPRENIRRAMRGEGLWTPVSSEIMELSPRINPDNVARGFVMETNTIDNDTEAGGPDMFGVIWEWVPQVWGSMVRAEADQLLPDISKWEEAVRFPDPAAWDWEGNARDNSQFFDPDRPTMVMLLNGLFERLISFMGFENAAVALVDEEQKPYVHALFDRLCSLYENIFALDKKYYDAEIVYFHDDWGGQHAPFFSPATVREMILPYLKRMVDSAHANGMIFDFHSCGKNEMLVPVMIEAGVDIWSGQPLNDMAALLEKYAGQICFDVSPEFEFDTEYSDEEIETIMKDFLKKYDPYLGSIFVRSFVNSDLIFELTYAASRKKSADLKN